MMDTKKWVLTGVVALVIFVGGVWVGAQNIVQSHMGALASASISAEQPLGVDFAPVWKSWNVLNSRFAPPLAPANANEDGDAEDGEGSRQESGAYEPVADEDKVWGMIEGLAASLNDPYTVFLPPSESKVFNDDISGSFEGVGMEIAVRNNVLTIVSPLKGTPAYRAGLKAGDLIVSIDGVSTENMGSNEAVQRIRGERGTSVVFEILHEGGSEVKEISVERDVIEIPTINTTLRNDGVFVIELMNFSARSPELFRQALREFVATETPYLVLDLRGNPGGYLEAAVDMASWFLPEGKVVVTEDYGDKQESIVHRSHGYDIFNDGLQMVILIDRGSASASEILAGALRVHNKATLIGTNSFGKGSVQELVEITPETSLKVTVAHWLLPDGSTISYEGIAPDVEVELPEDETVDDTNDLILDRAIDFLLKGE